MGACSIGYRVGSGDSAVSHRARQSPCSQPLTANFLCYDLTDDFRCPPANRHPMGRAASPSMPMNVGCLGRLGIRGSRSQHHATPCRHRLLLGRAMLGSFRAVHRVIVDFLVSVVCVHGVASGLREVFIDRDLECDAPWRRQPERRWPKESPGYRHPRSVALYRRCRTRVRACWMA